MDEQIVVYGIGTVLSNTNITELLMIQQISESQKHYTMGKKSNAKD